MKSLKTVLILTCFLALIRLEANAQTVKTDSIMSGPHEGQFNQTGQYYIEMLFSTVDTYVYLFDTNLHPISNIGITGKIIFRQYDNTTAAIELKPFKENGFTAKTDIPIYYSCTIIFDIKGKQISTNFQYLESIAESKK